MEETKEKSYSEIKKDFYYRYSKYAVPIISDYEGERKTTFVFALFVSISLILLGVLFLVIMFYSKIRTSDIGVALITLGLIAYDVIKKKFENKIKKKIMPVVCACFPKLKWKEPEKYNNLWDKINSIYGKPISNFPEKSYVKQYVKSNLISYFDRIELDDCFDGEYKNTKFTIRENYAEVGGGKNGRTIFKGVIVTIEMNKNFNGNTVIRPDSMFHTSPSKNLHHTVLEDVEFEKKFDVYTDDDVEARYLITPSLMERLKSMQVAFKANKISAAFYQNKFFIALHTNKDLFSLGSLTKNVCDKEQFFTMFEEILSIIKLIDHFKLDQKIGL